ncbi:MAG: hypothetical protein BGO49_05300 [Planctomycetales bacterium 71-10]|nr:MAG: hypothetical protein BGO49_05300 [Planctomycetales bacterium 71-10]
MDSKSLASQLLEEVRKDGERPAIDRWKELIARGAIDEKGRVLLRAPYPMMSSKRKKKSR